MRCCRLGGGREEIFHRLGLATRASRCAFSNGAWLESRVRWTDALGTCERWLNVKRKTIVRKWFSTDGVELSAIHGMPFEGGTGTFPVTRQGKNMLLYLEECHNRYIDMNIQGSFKGSGAVRYPGFLMRAEPISFIYAHAVALVL